MRHPARLMCSCALLACLCGPLGLRLEARAQPSFTKPIVTQERARKAVAGPEARDDSPQAVERDRQDAQAGKAEAQYALGLRHLEGGGVQRDPAAARLLWEQAAAQGHAGAEYRLGLLLRQGQGGPRDVPGAGRVLLQAAQQGVGGAQFQVAEMYAAGEMGPPDKDAALQWYRASGAQGDREALFRAGMLLLSGEGVRQSDHEAFDLLTLSARKGFPKAMHNLGVLYALGRGTGRDLAQAAKWERLASGLGVTEAQFAYGVMLLRGQGVLQDHAEGLRTLRLAASGGHARAKALLAQADASDDAARNLPQATRELRDKALAGDTPSRVHLGTLYAAGAGGLKKDPAQAFLWLELAARDGDPVATAHRDALNLKPAEQERIRARIGALSPQTVQ